MSDVEYVMTVLENVLDSRRKRHIVGGILLSVSLLFGGLAITTMTLRKGDNE